MYQRDPRAVSQLANVCIDELTNRDYSSVVRGRVVLKSEMPMVCPFSTSSPNKQSWHVRQYPTSSNHPSDPSDWTRCWWTMSVIWQLPMTERPFYHYWKLHILLYALFLVNNGTSWYIGSDPCFPRYATGQGSWRWNYFSRIARFWITEKSQRACTKQDPPHYRHYWIQVSFCSPLGFKADDQARMQRGV